MPPNKISKIKAEYYAPAYSEMCKECNMLKNLNNCTLVTGTVARNGHCKHWEKKKSLPMQG